MFHATNVIVNIPAFTPGTFAPVTVTFTVINPNLPVDFTLGASSLFHGVIIRAQCPGAPPLIDPSDENPFLDRISPFESIPTAENSFVIDQIKSEKGLPSFLAVNATNSVLNIPAYLSGVSNLVKGDSHHY